MIIYQIVDKVFSIKRHSFYNQKYIAKIIEFIDKDHKNILFLLQSI